VVLSDPPTRLVISFFCASTHTPSSAQANSRSMTASGPLKTRLLHTDILFLGQCLMILVLCLCSTTGPSRVSHRFGVPGTIRNGMFDTLSCPPSEHVRAQVHSVSFRWSPTTQGGAEKCHRRACAGLGSVWCFNSVLCYWIHCLRPTAVLYGAAGARLYCFHPFFPTKSSSVQFIRCHKSKR
jgi:hypothetical protein